MLLKGGNIMSTNKKILIISPIYFPFHVGGAEISTQILAEELNSISDYEITILTHSLSDEKEKVNGVRVIRKNFSIKSESVFKTISGTKSSLLSKVIIRILEILPSIKMRKYYSKLFKDFDVVVLSGNGIKMNRKDIIWAANNVQKPFVQIVRDAYLLYLIHSGGFASKVINSMYRYCNKTKFDEQIFNVGITKWILDLHSQNKIKMCNQCVIPNMFKESLYKRNYDEKENKILYVGTVGKYKGVHTLIKAFLTHIPESSGYKLQIIGQIKDVVIPDNSRIEVLGHMTNDEVQIMMSLAKVVVLPSEWDEAFGRTIVEAIFNGTLAIGSDRGGIPEVLGYDKDYIFKSGSSEELASKLNSVINLSKEQYEERLDILTKEFKKYSIKYNLVLWKQFLSNLN